MEEYLYIIIAVIYLIFNAYRGIKKKQQEQSNGKPVSERQTRERKIENILEELLEEHEEHKEHEEKKIISFQTPEKEKKQPRSFLAREPKNPIKHKSHKHKKRISEEEEPAAEHELNIRQAIIHQAILDRPYE